MSKTVVVCCKLPHGIVLQHPINPAAQVTLSGSNKESIIGAGYGTTEVDAEFWDAWLALHAEFAPVKSGAIFAAKSRDEATGKAKERKAEKTGFEAMPQDAGGVKPADEKE